MGTDQNHFFHGMYMSFMYLKCIQIAVSHHHILWTNGITPQAGRDRI